MLWTRAWDTIDEVVRRFEQDFTDLVGRTFGTGPSGDGLRTIPVEVVRTEGELRIRAELPGVDPEKVEVTTTGDTLRIRAERPEVLPEGAEYLRRELAYGTFHREVALPQGADHEGMTAQYEGGILEITVPYRASKAVKIPVEVRGGEQKALTAAAA